MVRIKCLRGLRQDHFQCRPDVGFENMTAVSGPIRFAEHDVGVDLRDAVLESDIADQRKHFHLLHNRYFLVFFLVAIEIAKHDIPKGANRCEVTGAEIIFLGKRSQLIDKFISFIEYDRKRLLPLLIDQLGFHLALRWIMQTSLR